METREEITIQWYDLETSLQNSYSSLDGLMNPVLGRLRDRRIYKAEVQFVLSQYSLLPATIVDFLKTGADRLKDWPAAMTELERNAAEELGSRTRGLSHYSILKMALDKELGLDISEVKPTKSTQQFLDLIHGGLARSNPAFVAGILYALEDSAVPELKIVAEIVNGYAKLDGHKSNPIRLQSLKAHRKDHKLHNELEAYTLNSFFAMHLYDFEIGHKTRLYGALQPYISLMDFQDFKEGFMYTLNAMDNWWECLAYPDSEESLLIWESCIEQYCISNRESQFTDLWLL